MINLVNGVLIKEHQQRNKDAVITESFNFIDSQLPAVANIIDTTTDTSKLKTVLESVSIDDMYFEDACEKLYNSANKI